MKNNTTVLHQWKISPFCGKVRRILDEKGIPYQTKNYNGMLVPFAATLSGVGKLPVLDIKGERVTDSHTIAVYLEQHYPDSKKLIPVDDQQKALMTIYEDWADSSLYWYNFYFRLKYDDAWEKAVDYFSEGRPFYEKMIVKVAGRRQYMKQLNGQGLGRYPKPQVEANFIMLVEQLNMTLSKKDWLVGDTQSLADIAVASQLHEVIRTSHMVNALTALPFLNDWLKRT